MKNYKSAKYAVLSFALATGLFVGCGGGGGGGGGFFLQSWYDVFGFYCGSGDPQPGCNFYSNGDKIIDVEDPYFFGFYNLEFGIWSYVDTFGFSQIYVGFAWLSPTGVLYNDSGYALNEEGEQERGRDIVDQYAALEQKAIETSGKEWADEHALSVATGLKVSQTLNDVATFAKKSGRDVNDADAAGFAKRLGNVDANQLKKDLAKAKQGDLSGLKAQNATIAAYWGATESESEEILADWFSDTLRGYTR